MRQLVKEKENSEFKHVKLRLKIDLESYPARAEGLGKYDNKVSVAQRGTDTPGATKQLLQRNRIFKRKIYTYIYIYIYVCVCVCVCVYVCVCMCVFVTLTQ